MFKKKKVTPVSLGMRILIGGYLCYLAYSLIPAIQNSPNTKEMVFWIAMVAVFAIIGALAIVFSAKDLIKGEYDKGNEIEQDKKE